MTASYVPLLIKLTQPPLIALAYLTAPFAWLFVHALMWLWPRNYCKHPARFLDDSNYPMCRRCGAIVARRAN